MTEVPSVEEQVIRAAFEAGRYEVAATASLERYGNEIFTFLVARLRSTSDAREAFSMFAEDMWIGLPAFAWRCSMRTWAYTLARNAAARYASAPYRRARNNVDLSNAGAFADLLERTRSATHAYRRTDVKDAFRELRERLDPEDQMILVLRVDRGLAWRDLAMAMAGDASLDDAALARESARLRKAFERIKQSLKEMAQEAGLLEREQ
jgi:RNA polymerase sigma-70 factor (ECF subfamily)